MLIQSAARPLTTPGLRSSQAPKPPEQVDRFHPVQDLIDYAPTLGELNSQRAALGTTAAMAAAVPAVGLLVHGAGYVLNSARIPEETSAVGALANLGGVVLWSLGHPGLAALPLAVSAAMGFIEGSDHPAASR